MISRAALMSCSLENVPCCAKTFTAENAQHSSAALADNLRILGFSFMKNNSCGPGRRVRDLRQRGLVLGLSPFSFVRQAYRVFGRRFWPDWQTGADAVLQDAGSKVVFVIPFNFRHLQETINQINRAAVARVS